MVMVHSTVAAMHRTFAAAQYGSHPLRSLLDLAGVLRTLCDQLDHGSSGCRLPFDVAEFSSLMHRTVMLTLL
jgi:hypothetical protein